MKKIRVIHILHSFGTGGMEKGVATIISHASEAFEQIVLCLTTSGETARLLPAATKIIELHKKPGNSPGFYFELAKNIRKQYPSIVDTRNWGGTDKNRQIIFDNIECLVPPAGLFPGRQVQKRHC